MPLIDPLILVLNTRIFLIQIYTTDLCVPISKLPYVLVETKKDLEQSRFTGELASEELIQFLY